MAIVIKCAGAAGPFNCPSTGKFLKACDFEAHNGRGLATFTADMKKAMRFPDRAAAFSYWHTVSTTAPTRRDGKPNRPLTAFHIEIMEDV